eukprot:gene10027-10183_t
MSGSTRLRLDVHEDLVTQQQVQLGLKRLWYKQPDDCVTIEDVTLRVLSDLGLAAGANVCHNVLLTVDGFTMPPDAPADLLRDGDLVVLLPAAVQVSELRQGMVLSYDASSGSYNGLLNDGMGNGAADACVRGGTLAVEPRPGRSSRGGARRTAIGPLLKALRAQAAEQGDGISTFAEA